MRIVNWILRRKILMLAIMAVMITANAQNVSYITSHKSIAADLSEQYGIPYSVILAVAIVESSAGNGTAAKKLNNHFGIVGSNHLQPGGFKSRYKAYETDQESYADFCRLIASKAFYADMKDRTDPKEWVKAISHTGYSTKPKVWEKRILKTIATNKL